MKTLILGASGMLGHMVSFYFKKKYHSDVILCSRSKTNKVTLDKTLIKISEYSKKQLSVLIDQYRPCIIVNCVAITNITTSQKELDLINSELPKLLVNILDNKNDGSHLVHISTNGVFSGKQGNYVESDQPDTNDIYGKTKLKGEVVHFPHLTIRTSIIGPQLTSNTGLLEWFLKQENEVKGYAEVKWNGVTTLECAKFIDWAINQKMTGLVHLFSKKISKYDLLNIIKKAYGKNIKIYPDNNTKSDQTLNTSRLDVNYIVPSHYAMLNKLKKISF